MLGLCNCCRSINVIPSSPSFFFSFALYLQVSYQPDFSLSFDLIDATNAFTYLVVENGMLIFDTESSLFRKLGSWSLPKRSFSSPSTRSVAATEVALRLAGHSIAAESVTAYASTTAKEHLLALFKY